MNRKCEQSVATDERRTFTKALGADKDKVHRDQTLGNTGGNNNKDAMFDWRSGCQCQSKDKRNSSYSYTPYSKMAAASDDLGRVARERGIEGHDSFPEQFSVFRELMERYFNAILFVNFFLTPGNTTVLRHISDYTTTCKHVNIESWPSMPRSRATRPRSSEAAAILE